jgi:hypothetical protein
MDMYRPTFSVEEAFFLMAENTPQKVPISAHVLSNGADPKINTRPSIQHTTVEGWYRRDQSPRVRHCAME